MKIQKMPIKIAFPWWSKPRPKSRGLPSVTWLPDQKYFFENPAFARSATIYNKQ
jgi:hypothetical protein